MSAHKFWAARRMQPKLSLGSATSLEAPSTDLGADVELPADILAHRPEGHENHACSVMPNLLGNWSSSSSSAGMSPAVVGGRTNLDTIDERSAPYTHSKQHLQQVTALSHSPKSFECELESLMGHAVKGVLLGER